MKWFRLWTDILDDVKILQLTDYEYRIWISLLCYACDVNSMYGECRINVTSMSIRFRTRVSHLKHAIETFQNLSLITISKDGFVNITNWSKRQFKSDNAYDRVVKYRESKQDMKRFNPVTRNVSETVPDTDTDTDTEKNIVKKVVRRVFVKPTIEEISSYCLDRGRGINPQTFFDHYTGNGWMVGRNPMKDWRAVVRTWESRGGNENVGIRTSRSDPRDKNLQSREDAEIAAITAKWKASKKAAGDRSGGDARNDDAPDFQR